MNLRHYIFLLAFLIAPYLGYSQNLPTKKEQYDFLKWYVNYKKFKPLSDTTAFFDYNFTDQYSMSKNMLNSLKVSAKNKAFLKKQILIYNKHSLLDTSLLKLDTSKVGYLRYHISFPIFSTDRKTVLISWGYSCGKDCGKKSIEAYIKSTNEKWRPAKIPFEVIYIVN